ncbi:cation-translocating P-type ATPase [Nocardioides hungaricus]
MSDECCGADEPRRRKAKDGAARRMLTLTPATTPVAAPETEGRQDACCASDGPVRAAAPVDEGDACCGPDEGGHAHDDLAVRPPLWRDPAMLPSAISGVALLLGYALGWAGLPTAGLVAHWVALLVGAWTFVPGALRRLARGRLGVGLLMTIGAVGGVLLGYVGEAAALAFLFSLAESLEHRALDRAKEGLRGLLSLIPDTVRVARPDGDQTIPAADVRRSDVLVVVAGERIATDGIVTEGRSSLDTSAVTGESIPVAVGPGDRVLAGSVNGSAALRVEATADGSDNSLTQIVALVEQAHARKGERARLADKIARPLVPTVLMISVLVAVVGSLLGDPDVWIVRALVLLVAASPCALAIAVPVTVISAIGAASKFGVVVKSGQAFEEFGTIRTVVFDKTGTLTRNEPQVVHVAAAAGATEDEVLALAAALEASSSHPLADAITAAAPGAASRVAVADVTEGAGHGLTGQVDGRRVRVGNVRWLDPQDLTGRADAMAGEGMTVVVVEADDRVLGLIGVRDELRPEAAETIAMLHERGIRTVMLTGDNARTAHALAAEAGITDVRAEQLPSDKAAAIAALVAEGPTAMVGDGINDAPALATATVGIAMGLKGSDAAIESADIAFTGTDLRLIPGALAHARRGRRIMTANVGLALLLLVALFPLALLGILGLATIVLVHEIAEVVIILNGVRAARRPDIAHTVGAAATTRERELVHSSS